MSSKSSFTHSFQKIAIAGVVGKGLMALGKGAIRLGGGKLNTALTAAGAMSDFGDISKKMRDAAQR